MSEKKPHVIECVYAFVTTDVDGSEGVLAGYLPGMGWIPLIGADGDRIEQLSQLAEEIRHATGKEYKLLKFSTRTDVTEMVKR